MKSILASKTFYWNLITIIISILALPEFISLIPSTYLPLIALVSATGNLILRTYFTSTAIE